MRRLAVALAVLLCAASLAAAGQAARPVPEARRLLEDEVLAELNRARTDPRTYAERLRELRRSFRDRFTFIEGGTAFLTREGVEAVDEAIAFLAGAPAAIAMKASPGLARAAGDHMRDQALHGGVGHAGSDGSDPTARMARYVQLESQDAAVLARRVLVGEVIGYGRQEARAIVAMLLVDDGVPGRGHRQAIFNPDYTHAGVACGSHPVHGSLCVIDLAGSIREKGG